MRKINWDKIKTRLDALLVIDEYLTDPSEDWLRLVIKTEEDYGVRYLIDNGSGDSLDVILNEFFGYVEKTLELNDFDTIDEYGVACNFHPPYEYSQLEIYDYNDHSGFTVDYEMTSNSELVDMTLQLEFLYTKDGYKVRFLNIDSD